jgi:hypothetical protein
VCAEGARKKFSYDFLHGVKRKSFSYTWDLVFSKWIRLDLIGDIEKAGIVDLVVWCCDEAMQT